MQIVYKSLTKEYTVERCKLNEKLEVYNYLWNKK